MLINGQLIFKIATGLYGLSLICRVAHDRLSRAELFFLVPAVLANGLVIAGRYWSAWPMLPMYMGPVVLPLLLGMVLVFRRHPDGGWTRPVILSQIVLIALAAVFFPKDYYIPFIKSQTLWAHLFFWLGVAGRACFLVAAAWAMTGLMRKKTEVNAGRDGRAFVTPPLPPSFPPWGQASPASRSMQWIVWGFALWTLSMFAGERWSYLGWGTPVVWDDPAITTAMATWFFYICLLHLHLTGSWTVRGRTVYAAVGGLVVLGLNCVPELGPLRWPV